MKIIKEIIGKGYEVVEEYKKKKRKEGRRGMEIKR